MLTLIRRWLFGDQPAEVRVEMTPRRGRRRRTEFILDRLELPKSIPWRTRRKLRRALEEHTRTMVVLTPEEAEEWARARR